jgi:copper chaperone CopZ
MKKVTIQLETLGCPSCTIKIENAVRGLQGVDKESVKVLFNASKVKLDYDDSQVAIKEIEDAISKQGYIVEKTVIKDL